MSEYTMRVFQIIGPGYGGRVDVTWSVKRGKNFKCSGCNSVLRHYPKPMDVYLTTVETRGVSSPWGERVALINVALLPYIRRRLPGAVYGRVFQLMRKHMDSGYTILKAFDPSRHRPRLDYVSAHVDASHAVQIVSALPPHEEAPACEICGEPRDHAFRPLAIRRADWGRRTAALSCGPTLLLREDVVASIPWDRIPPVSKIRVTIV